MCRCVFVAFLFAAFASADDLDKNVLAKHLDGPSRDVGNVALPG
jgi:hypothetical protein